MRSGDGRYAERWSETMKNDKAEHPSTPPQPLETRNGTDGLWQPVMPSWRQSVPPTSPTAREPQSKEYEESRKILRDVLSINPDYEHTRILHLMNWRLAYVSHVSQPLRDERDEWRDKMQCRNTRAERRAETAELSLREKKQECCHWQGQAGKFQQNRDYWKAQYETLKAEKQGEIDNNFNTYVANLQASTELNATLRSRVEALEGIVKELATTSWQRPGLGMKCKLCGAWAREIANLQHDSECLISRAQIAVKESK